MHPRPATATVKKTSDIDAQAMTVIFLNCLKYNMSKADAAHFDEQNKVSSSKYASQITNDTAVKALTIKNASDCDLQRPWRCNNWTLHA